MSWRNPTSSTWTRGNYDTTGSSSIASGSGESPGRYRERQLGASGPQNPGRPTDHYSSGRRKPGEEGNTSRDHRSGPRDSFCCHYFEAGTEGPCSYVIEEHNVLGRPRELSRRYENRDALPPSGPTSMLPPETDILADSSSYPMTHRGVERSSASRAGPRPEKDALARSQELIDELFRLNKEMERGILGLRECNDRLKRRRERMRQAEGTRTICTPSTHGTNLPRAETEPASDPRPYRTTTPSFLHTPNSSHERQAGEGSPRDTSGADSSSSSSSSSPRDPSSPRPRKRSIIPQNAPKEKTKGSRDGQGSKPSQSEDASDCSSRGTVVVERTECSRLEPYYCPHHARLLHEQAASCFCPCHHGHQTVDTQLTMSRRCTCSCHRMARQKKERSPSRARNSKSPTQNPASVENKKSPTQSPASVENNMSPTQSPASVENNMSPTQSLASVENNTGAKEEARKEKPPSPSGQETSTN